MTPETMIREGLTLLEILAIEGALSGDHAMRPASMGLPRRENHFAQLASQRLSYGLDAARCGLP
jgi:hypothetical protein